MSFDWQPSTTAELIEKLEQHKTHKRGKSFKQTFELHTESGTTKSLDSWKFSEWDYGKPDKIQLPTHARGLFVLDGQVAVRGYDKFFNVDEVYFTKWRWLEKNTAGPYIVTTKENGCIMFFAGLADGTLLTCSKHWYGPKADGADSHADAGERALEKQLEAMGITKREFALKLHELNLTAVAEYCDDTFEEHVVEYPADRAGLYLHGLNVNQPKFSTKPMEEVITFADKFGFKTVDYFQKDDITTLEDFLAECAKTGTFNGRETEGFVVRSKVQTGEDYFFKYKFDEPYLMYRQLREVTRKYITTKDRMEIKFNNHKYITNKYLDFVVPILDKDPELCERFLKGFGIISLRKKFLEQYGMSGVEVLNHEKIMELEEMNTALDQLTIDERTKFMLVPIATIGCGKTTSAMTITGCLDDWALVINDEVPNGKNGPTEFVKRGLAQLKEGKKVVVMDRNNHQFRERKQIFSTVGRLKAEYLAFGTNIQFICLNYVKEDVDEKELWEITRKRVFDRGDNHQSIKAASDDPAKVEKIMKGFIDRFQPCVTDVEPDSLFDLVIDLEVGDSLKNAKTILTALSEKYPVNFKEIPTDEQLQESFQKALLFKPTFTKFQPKKSKGPAQTPPKPKAKKPVYFGLQVPPTLLTPYFESLLADHDSLYTKLKDNSRVQDEFHITVCHVIQARKGTERDKQIWDKLLSLEPNSVTASLNLASVIWDEKAMCILVDNIKFSDEDVEVSNKHPHITIGTASEEIPPVYSNTLAQLADDGDPSVTKIEWTGERPLLDHIPLVANY